MFNLITKCVENFTDSESDTGAAIAKSLTLLVSMVISQILLLVVGKYLWNTCLVDVVSFAKPIDTIFKLFGVSLLLRLLVN